MPWIEQLFTVVSLDSINKKIPFEWGLMLQKAHSFQAIKSGLQAVQ